MAATTAVVAGTAGAVRHHQEQKYTNQAEQQQAQEQAAYDASMAAAPPQAAPAMDLTAELEKLGSLKAAGVLTDEEFAAAKAKLLA
jgi:hypothetical protein